MKLDNATRAVLLLVIGTLVLGGLYLLLHPFTSPRVPYVIETDRPVTGLREQSTVFFRGVPVGIVDGISFGPGGFPSVRIEISVDAQYPLTENTFARMTAAGLTSGLQLELDFAAPGGRVLTPSRSERSPIRLEPELMDQIQDSLAAAAARLDKVLASVDEVLASVHGILDVASEERIAKLIDTANETLHNLSAGTRDLPETERRIRTAAASIAALADELEARTEAMPELIASATRLSARADAMVPRVQTALDDVSVATEQLRELAALLTEDPQALLSGRAKQEPGPGELGR